MDIPVFLFTGFLESGKTSFIRDTVEDPNFTEGDKILVIACEEGEEEYDAKSLATNKVILFKKSGRFIVLYIISPIWLTPLLSVLKPVAILAKSKLDKPY